jgi:glycolate oxidase FAD binding subunit
MLDTIVEQVKASAAAGQPRRIVGGNSKAFLGYDLSDIEPLHTTGLNNVISYECSELVVHAQAGYPVKDLVALLDTENQMLGFDPTDFGGSTIGGVVATGLSGSRRPYRGAGRDFLLGVTMVDGHGEVLKFGGQVMKNVAGYDISRLLCGSHGCLGVITDVSFKVLPKPESEVTAKKPVDANRLLALMSRQGGLSETTATAYWQGELYVRYTGSESSVNACLRSFDGKICSNEFWDQVDRHELFADAPELWRVSAEVNDPANGFEQAGLIDWGGAQRWLTSEPEISDTAHRTCIRSANDVQRFSDLPPYLMGIHQRLKTKFDPKGIFNPGKMYPEL